MKLSVTARLTLVVAALMGVVAATAAIVAPSIVEDALVEDILDASAEESSYLFADAVGDFGGFDPVDDALFAASLLDDVAADGKVEELIEFGGGDELIVALGGSSFVAIDRNGVLFSFETAIESLDQPVLPILDLIKLDPFGDEFDALGAGGSFADVDLAIDVRSIEGVDVIVVGDIASVARSVDSVGNVLWAATPIVTVFAALVAWLLASRALRPVRSITQQAATISAGTLDTRVPVPNTADEIADLASTVNDMLDRLESDDRRRRRFVSDASHELRSPVAVLRSEAEVALRDPGSIGVDGLATAVLAESGRMGTIIDDLLALARHDEGLPPPATTIDLDDVVLAEAGRARRVPVDVTGVSGGRVPGRSDELTRMVGHLLDNAARHADSLVRVSLQTTTHAVSLVVDDDGPGVPVDQREAIFERFTRLDAARSRDNGGAGLGLAVVASIAKRSGGAVTVGDSDLGGAQFTLTWPVG